MSTLMRTFINDWALLIIATEQQISMFKWFLKDHALNNISQKYNHFEKGYFTFQNEYIFVICYLRHDPSEIILLKNNY